MQSKDRKTLLAAVAVSSLAAGAAGVLLGATVLTRAEKPAATAPAEQAHVSQASRVLMSADRIRADGIELIAPRPGGLDAAILVQAQVVASPGGAAILAARAEGAIVRINKRLGDSVRAGEAIGAIESRDAAAISAERAIAAARAAAARNALARETKLFDARITARKDLETAQAEAAIAEAELRRATSAGAAAGVSRDGRIISVVSPIAGRITAAPAVLGAYVPAGAELFRVADPNRIELHAALPAIDARRVRPGDMATVETPAGDIAATVRSVTPGLDAESRSATAVLTLSQAADLSPGQAVRVRIIPRQGVAAADRFAAPDEAAQSIEGVEVVFVRTAHGFEARRVGVGRRAGGQVEIVSGLKAGEQIAGRGAFLLKAELGKGEGEH